MASEGSTIHSDDPTQSASLIAHAASLKSSMHPWRPRDGKCDDRDLFHDSLVDNMIALGLHPDCVNWPVPTKAAVRKTQPNIREPQVSEMLNAAIIEYQAQGTAIYIMCKPALILTGVHQNEDLEEIRTFTHGKNRDGRGLIEWAEQWCDDTTFDAQSDIRRRMDAIKFISDMTLAQFHTTSRNLYKLWCRIATNDASDPTSFWLLYLHLMPSTPSASHMAQLRTELAKDMTKKDPILLEPATQSTGFVRSWRQVRLTRVLPDILLVVRVRSTSVLYSMKTSSMQHDQARALLRAASLSCESSSLRTTALRCSRRSYPPPWCA